MRKNFFDKYADDEEWHERLRQKVEEDDRRLEERRRKERGRRKPHRLTSAEQRLLDLFEAMEEHRHVLHNAAAEYLHHVNKHPALGEIWERFLDGGGSTSADLRKLLLGARGSKRQVTRRALIRCVVNNPSLPGQEKKWSPLEEEDNEDGPEAA